MMSPYIISWRPWATLNEYKNFQQVNPVFYQQEPLKPHSPISRKKISYQEQLSPPPLIPIIRSHRPKPLRIFFFGGGGGGISGNFAFAESSAPLISDISSLLADGPHNLRPNFQLPLPSCRCQGSYEPPMLKRAVPFDMGSSDSHVFKLFLFP